MSTKVCSYLRRVSYCVTFGTSFIIKNPRRIRAANNTGVGAVLFPQFLIRIVSMHSFLNSCNSLTPKSVRIFVAGTELASFERRLSSTRDGTLLKNPCKGRTLPDRPNFDELSCEILLVLSQTLVPPSRFLLSASAGVFHFFLTDFVVSKRVLGFSFCFH